MAKTENVDLVFEYVLAGLACLIFGAILGVAYLGLTS